MTVKKLPANAAHGLGKEINLAARAMRALLDSRLLHAETNFATWSVLFSLDVEGPVIQRELAQRLEVEGPTLVRRLDQLEKEGLVLRSDSPSDRRATRVALTDAGRALFKRIRSSVADTEREVVRDLAPAEVETTLRVLRHLINRCRQLTKSPNS
jgi:MarR family transcriptional regulator, transcriptional regulator for hemolysin